MYQGILNFQYLRNLQRPKRREHTTMDGRHHVSISPTIPDRSEYQNDGSSPSKSKDDMIASLLGNSLSPPQPPQRKRLGRPRGSRSQASGPLAASVQKLAYHSERAASLRAKMNAMQQHSAHRAHDPMGGAAQALRQRMIAEDIRKKQEQLDNSRRDALRYDRSVVLLSRQNPSNILSRNRNAPPSNILSQNVNSSYGDNEVEMAMQRINQSRIFERRDTFVPSNGNSTHSDSLFHNGNNGHINREEEPWRAQLQTWAYAEGTPNTEEMEVNKPQIPKAFGGGEIVDLGSGSDDDDDEEEEEQQIISRSAAVDAFFNPPNAVEANPEVTRTTPSVDGAFTERMTLQDWI